MENTPQVDVNHLVKLRQRHFLQPGVLGDAGVVHQHIDAAELILNLRHHGIDHLAVGHVHQAAYGLCAQRLALRNGGVHARLPQVADNHDGAFGGKFEGGGQAYALRCAGDDADFVQ